jgi:hypothetical protein
VNDGELLKPICWFFCPQEVARTAKQFTEEPRRNSSPVFVSTREDGTHVWGLDALTPYMQQHERPLL